MSTPAATTPRETTHEGVTKRRIAPLLARRRENLDRDRHVTCHDYVDDAGRKIREFVQEGREGTTKTVRVNYSALFGAAPSTSTNLEVLLTEARQAADATPEEIENMNPHVPSNDDVLETATERIESEGLVPAWEVVDR